MADKKQNKNIDVPKKDQEEMPNQEEQLAEMESNWKRALADYQNLQKRVAEEKVNFTQFANGTLIRKLLPVLDSLEMIKELLSYMPQNNLETTPHVEPTDKINRMDKKLKTIIPPDPIIDPTSASFS